MNQLIVSGWGVNDQNIGTFRCNAMGNFSIIFSYKEMNYMEIRKLFSCKEIVTNEKVKKWKN